MNDIKLLLILLFIISCSGVTKSKRVPAGFMGECESLFLKKPKKGVVYSTKLSLKFIPGQNYVIQPSGSSRLLKVKFVKGGRTRNGAYDLDFVRIKDKKPIHFSDGNLFGARLYRPPKVASKVVQKTVEQVLVADTISKLMFFPYRTLTRAGSVEVVGGIASSKQLGQKVLNETLSFDDTMRSLGFETPERTRIIVSDRPVLPSFTGPFSLNYPTLNIWTGKASKIIAMNPLVWRTKAVGESSVLFHERMHALLHRTYNKKSFINKSKAFQEAFADFAAAYKGKNSEIGRDVLSDNGVLRNLRNGQYEGHEHYDSMKGLIDITSEDYHNNSLLVSRLLWRIRAEIGEERTGFLMKSLIDDLNSFRSSYLEKVELVSYGKVLEPRQRFANDIEFFLAVLKKKPRQELGLDGVEVVIDEYAKALGMEPRRIEEVSNLLFSDGVDYAYRGEKQMQQGLVVGAYAGVGVGINLGLLYWLFGDDVKGSEGKE